MLRTLIGDEKSWRAGIPAHVTALCHALAAAGHEAFVVGGAVRDLQLGRAAKDFDVATRATPAEVAKVFGRKRTIPTGEKHGTMTVLTEDEGGERVPIEVTTYRGDGAYTDGRRPDEITFVRTIEEDLQRRDFTVNAMAYDPIAHRLVDPFGGREDLALGVLRAVGVPLDRFNEDGLRAMRAVRFCAQHEFTLDAATEAAIPRALAVFRKVSPERVRDELVKMLLAPRPSIGLELMRKTQLLGEVIPELLPTIGCVQNRFHAHDVWQHTLHVVDSTALGSTVGPSWLVRAAALFHDVAKPQTAAPKEGAPGEFTFYRHEFVGASITDAVAKRLHFSNAEREHVVNLVFNHMFWYSSEWTDGTVRRFMGRVGSESVSDLFALRAGDVLGRGHAENPGVEIDELRARIDEQIRTQAALKVTDLRIDGKDVMRILACKPSRIIGDVLKALLERVLDDTALNDREKLEALVPEIATSLQSAPPPTR